MKDIRVVPEGHLYKVMVNFIQMAIYQSPLIANQYAKNLYTNGRQDYHLTLIDA